MTTHAQRTASERDSLSDSCTCSIIERASIRNIHWCFQLLQASFGGLCRMQLWEKNRPSDCLTLSADYVQLKLRLILSKKATPEKWQCCLGATPPQRLLTEGVIVQELCESRGGRPGLSILTNLLVSVDVKIYCPCFGIGHNLSLICQLTSEDIKQHFTEGVLRRATKLVRLGLKDLDYSERLECMDLPSMKYRRERRDMTETQQRTHGLTASTTVCWKWMLRQHWQEGTNHGPTYTTIQAEKVKMLRQPLRASKSLEPSVKIHTN